MGRKRRSFTSELKREAALLVLDQGYSVVEACRAMEVGESALRRWIDQLNTERQGITPKERALTPEQQRIQALEKQVKRLGLEKEIFKKATALLMQDELKSTR